MLVVVPLVLLDEKARFDAPAVAGTEVAALMDVIAVQWLAGEPGVARCLADGPGLFIDPLPSMSRRSSAGSASSSSTTRCFPT